jgi:hypothetical protein
VRESEEERASEIADEFYPQNRDLAEEQTCAAVGASEHAEQYTTICDLARQLWFSEAKIKILLGRRARNPVCLERKLRNQLDERPDDAVSRARQ